MSIPLWDPTCPVCTILAAMRHQVSAVQISLLWTVAKVPCRCAGHAHDPLVQHPHTRPGCCGYALRNTRHVA